MLRDPVRQRISKDFDTVSLPGNSDLEDAIGQKAFDLAYDAPHVADNAYTDVKGAVTTGLDTVKDAWKKATSWIP